MGEDIKILEEKKAIDDLFSLTHINGYIDLDKLKKATIYTSDLKKWQNGVKVLLNIRENLIKGYRELEKDLHEMTISNNHKKENWIHKNCLNDYIPKTKIKEKIEELKQKESIFSANKQGYSFAMVQYQINVLQELMEDK